MEYLYEKLKAFSPVSVVEKNLNGAEGYYSKKSKQIVIDNTSETNHKTSVLLHELTHCLYDDFDYSKNRDLSEVFVESVAYIVADYFGLDTSSCSFKYITSWAKGDVKTVIDLGTKIQKTANAFINKIEKFELQDIENIELVA